jgi:hypothetical protein
MALPVACGAAPGTGTASETRTASPNNVVPVQPLGWPRVIAWDGVSSKILMTEISRSQYPYPADSETYAFAGNKWTAVSPEQSISTISHRQLVLMVYDSDRSRELLVFWRYTGLGSQGTWQSDGKNWNQIPTLHPLPSMSSPSAAFSPDLHSVVVIDPCSSTPNKGWGDTLLFDGTDWRLVSPAHWPACPAVLGYSQVRHAIVALASAYDESFPGFKHGRLTERIGHRSLLWALQQA